MLVIKVLKGPDKGRCFQLPDDEPQLIGRSGESLPLTDPTISRRHAELTPDDGQWYLQDLNSANGTYVNGEPVQRRRLLMVGDQIRTGSSLFLFSQEMAVLPQRVRMVKSGEIDAHVSAAVASSEDSMVMAVPEPNKAAVLQLKVIYELTQLIGSIVDQQQLLEHVMALIFAHFQVDRGFILYHDVRRNRLDPIVVRHRLVNKDAKSPPITVSQTIVQHVIRKGEGLLSNNAMTDKRFASGESVQNYGIRSAMCVPIKFKDRLFGVIHIDSQIVNYTYTEDQLRLLTAIGVQTGLALANAQNYAKQIQRERLAAVGQTVASVSHSIKNILQGLRGGADVVELGLRKDNMKVVHGGWDIVARNLDRIYGLAMNMLTFSKQRKPEVELTQFPALLDEIVMLVQGQFDNKNVALLTDWEKDMPPVPVDPAGLHQAVLNLLNNALDAVEPGVGVVSVRCGYDPKALCAKITVSDNGKGIAPETSKHLFEPFYSTKGLRGTGLGLAVSKKVVEEHGGQIDVDGSSDRGTSFTLILPASQDGLPASDDTHAPLGTQANTKAAVPLTKNRNQEAAR